MSLRSIQHWVPLWLPVAILLAAMLLQAVLSMRLLSATFDESTHLPSGYTYLRTGDFRLNPQHPPLIKLLAATPLLVLQPELDLDDPGWRDEPYDEWGFGYRFLYGNDADRLLFWGRMPVVLLSLLLAFYVFLWARDLFGDAAGLLALFLCAFSPTVIAHARFVTFDVGLACFSTMTLYHLWRYLGAGSRLQLAAASVGLGLALASKYSGLVLLPVCLLLIGFDAWRRAHEDAPGRTRGAGNPVLAVGVLLLLAALLVQASYFFGGDLLAYWRGLMRVQQDHTVDFAYYLMGEFRSGGWWYYFPLAFLFKTPVPTLILLVLSVVLVRRHPTRSALDELFLVLPVAAFGGATCLFADNMGVRYLLPVYPLIFVFVSRLALATGAGRAVKGFAVVLGFWYLATTIAIFPDHLAYFNEFVGGPSRGHLYLDDSNIDWGQDLKRLDRYMELKGIESIRLNYGRNLSPEYYGIHAQPVTDGEWAGDPPPGLYAFGTHLLIRGEYYAQTHGLKTDWLSRYEPVERIGYSIWIYEFD